MSHNIWKQFRLIGSVLCIVAAFIHRWELSFIGILVIGVGTVGGLDRLERLLEEKDKPNDEA